MAKVLADPSTRAPALAGGSGSGFRPTGVLEGVTGLPVGLHLAFRITSSPEPFARCDFHFLDFSLSVSSSANSFSNSSSGGKIFSIAAGSIPRSPLRCDSDVGWVERQRYPSSPNGGYRRSAPPPTLQLRSNLVCSDPIPRSLLRGSSFAFFTDGKSCRTIRHTRFRSIPSYA